MIHFEAEFCILYICTIQYQSFQSEYGTDWWHLSSFHIKHDSNMDALLIKQIENNLDSCKNYCINNL